MKDWELHIALNDPNHPIHYELDAAMKETQTKRANGEGTVRYDLVLITTVEAKSLDEAESFLIDFADELADEYHAPFTTVGYTNNCDNDRKRMIYLHPVDESSKYDGPLEFGPTTGIFKKGR